MSVLEIVRMALGALSANRGRSALTVLSITIGAFAIVGEFLLLAEHRAHASAYLTWLLLLARPLIHALIPHGHGEHDSGGHEYAFILSDSPPTSTTAATTARA